MSQTPKQRLLAYAAERVGRAELAAKLKVQDTKLAEWLEGKSEVPDAKLGLLADVITGKPETRK